MYNRQIIVGRLVSQPEHKQTPNGIDVSSFCVAVDRPYRKGAEKQTDFFECVAWRNTAVFICNNFSKGEKILIEGAMQSREYVDKKENKRRVWELVAEHASFIGGKGESGGGDSLPAAQAESFEEIEDDGDLPFNSADSTAAQ